MGGIPRQSTRQTGISGLFAARMRYSGASIGARLASVAAGAPAPLIAAALLTTYDRTQPIAAYVALAAAITVGAVLSAQETRSRSLEDPEAGATLAATTDAAAHRLS